jgi:PAS domain-containing protein
MSSHSIELTRAAELRDRAASRLTGPAATKGPSAKAADALAVLHTLASSPATAQDALALLHELQVHQVEVEIQAEELRDSRAELESALRRQIELYDFLPVGCFTVDHKLVVSELNRTGGGLLGIDRDDAFGLPLDGFLSAESARTLRDSIARVGQGAHGATAKLQLTARDGAERRVRAVLSADRAGNRFLLVLTPPTKIPPARAPRADDDREVPRLLEAEYVPGRFTPTRSSRAASPRCRTPRG